MQLFIRWMEGSMRSNRSLILLVAGALVASLGVTACGGDEGGDREITMVEGNITLESTEGGPTSPTGAEVTIGEESTTIGPDGSFSLGVDPGTYTVSASLDEFVSAEKEIEVDDGETEEVTLRLEAERPPVVDSLVVDESELDPEASTMATIEATDPNGDELSYSWQATGGFQVSQNDGSSNQATVTAPADTGESGTIRVTIEDSTERTVTATADIQTVENAAPSISGVEASKRSDITPGETVQLTATADDPDGDDLSWDWSVAGDFSVESSNGSTATVAAPDSYDTSGTVQVTVTDPFDKSDTGSVSLSTASNNAPQIQAISANPAQLGPGEDGFLTAEVEDQESAAADLTYTWSTPSSDWTIDTQSARQTSVTAPNRYGETATFTLEVSDPEGNTTTGTVVLSTFANDGPRFSDITADPTNVERTQASRVTIRRPTDEDGNRIDWDPNGDDVNFNWSTSNADWTINGSGSSVDVIAPDEPQSSTTVTVEIVEANTEAQKTSTGSVGLSTPQNTAPENVSFSYVDGEKPVAGESFQLRGTAEDPDGDSLSYSWESLNSNWTIQSGETSQVVTIQAPDNKDAQASIELTVSDGFDSKTVPDFVRTQPNNAPVVDSATPGTDSNVGNRGRLDRGDSTSIQVSTSDPDGDSVEHTWDLVQGNSDGWSLSASGDQATLSAPDMPDTTGRVELTYTDGLTSNTVGWTFRTVRNDAPNCTAQSPGTTVTGVGEGMTQQTSITCSDPNGDDLTYDWRLASTNAQAGDRFGGQQPCNGSGWMLDTAGASSSDSNGATAPTSSNRRDVVVVTVEDEFGETASTTSFDESVYCTSTNGNTRVQGSATAYFPLESTSPNTAPEWNGNDLDGTTQAVSPGRVSKTFPTFDFYDQDTPLTGSKLGGPLAFTFNYDGFSNSDDAEAKWMPTDSSLVSKHGRMVDNQTFEFEVSDDTGKTRQFSFTVDARGPYQFSDRAQFNPIRSALNGAPTAVGFGDINGDGWPDVAATDGSELAIGLSDASSGSYTLGPNTSLAGNQANCDVELRIADFEGDGNKDVFVFCRGDQPNGIAPNGIAPKAYVARTNGARQFKGLNGSGNIGVADTFGNLTGGVIVRDLIVRNVDGGNLDFVLHARDQATGTQNAWTIFGEGTNSNGVFEFHDFLQPGNGVDTVDAHAAALTGGNTPVATFAANNDDSMFAVGDIRNRDQKRGVRIASSAVDSSCPTTTEGTGVDNCGPFDATLTDYEGETVDTASIRYHRNRHFRAKSCQEGDYEVQVQVDRGSDTWTGNTTVSMSSGCSARDLRDTIETELSKDDAWTKNGKGVSKPGVVSLNTSTDDAGSRLLIVSVDPKAGFDDLGISKSAPGSGDLSTDQVTFSETREIAVSGCSASADYEIELAVNNSDDTSSEYDTATTDYSVTSGDPCDKETIRNDLYTELTSDSNWDDSQPAAVSFSKESTNKIRVDFAKEAGFDSVSVSEGDSTTSSDFSFDTVGSITSTKPQTSSDVASMLKTALGNRISDNGLDLSQTSVMDASDSSFGGHGFVVSSNNRNPRSIAFDMTFSGDAQAWSDKDQEGRYRQVNFGNAETTIVTNNASAPDTDVQLADVDGGNGMDAIIFDGTSDTVAIATNDGSDSFTIHSRTNVPHGINPDSSMDNVAYGDFDQDGNADVLVGQPQTGAIAFGDGSGGIEGVMEADAEGRSLPTSAFMATYDRDGQNGTDAIWWDGSRFTTIW
jgi:predicted secreted protein